MVVGSMFCHMAEVYQLDLKGDCYPGLLQQIYPWLQLFKDKVRECLKTIIFYV